MAHIKILVMMKIYFALGIIVALFFILPFLAFFSEGHHIEIYVKIFKNHKNIAAICTTVLVAILTLALNFLVGFPAASVLYKNNSKLIKFINGFLYLPLIVPGLVITQGVLFTFIKLNIAETILGVVLIHGVLTLPYFIKAVVAGYRSIDENYYFLGKIVGASKLETFFEITLPKLFPSVITGSILVIIVSFAQYITTLIIGGGRIITLPLLIYPHIVSGNFQIGSVLGIIFVVTNLILLFTLEKFVKKLV
ncbi:MAG: ABC transporter permease [Fusobacteriaceae bacterium]